MASIDPPASERPSEQFVHIARTGSTFVVTGRPAFSVRHDPMEGGGAGVSADWMWDGSSVTATTCRFGTYPLYYFATRDAVCLSPSLTTLLAQGAPRELDDGAMAMFLRFGCCVGDDTPFAAIRRVPPAGRFEWRGDGHWQVAGRAERLRPETLDRRGALDAFIETFRTAVRRRACDRDSLLPLTGGRDSRHLLFELCRAGRRPRSVVTVRRRPPVPDEDVRAAALVAKVVGVEHIVLDEYPNRVETELRKNRLSAFAADWHAWSLPVVDLLARHPGSDVYAGYGGDTLARGRDLDREKNAAWRTRDAAVVTAYMLNKGTERRRDFRSLLTPGAEARFGTEAAQARLVREVELYLDHPNPDLSFTFSVGLRRRTAPQWFPLCSDHARVVTPYLDHALYDLMASLPLELGLDRSFHTEAIATAFPEYRDLPYFDAHLVPQPWEAAPFGRLADELTAYARSLGHSEIFDLPRLIARIDRSRQFAKDRFVFTVQPQRLLCLLQLEAWLATPTPSAGASGA